MLMRTVSIALAYVWVSCVPWSHQKLRAPRDDCKTASFANNGIEGPAQLYISDSSMRMLIYTLLSRCVGIRGPVKPRVSTLVPFSLKQQKCHQTPNFVFVDPGSGSGHCLRESTIPICSEERGKDFISMKRL